MNIPTLNLREQHEALEVLLTLSEENDLYIFGGLIKFSNRKIEQLYYIDEIPLELIKYIYSSIFYEQEFKSFLEDIKYSLKNINYIRCKNGKQLFRELINLKDNQINSEFLKELLGLEFKNIKPNKNSFVIVERSNAKKKFCGFQLYANPHNIEIVLKASEEEDIYLFGGSIRVINRSIEYIKNIDMIPYQIVTSPILYHAEKEVFDQELAEFGLSIKRLKYVKINTEDGSNLITKLTFEDNSCTRFSKLILLLDLKVENAVSKIFRLFYYKLFNMKNKFSKVTKIS